jgi:hypothetical protein
MPRCYARGPRPSTRRPANTRRPAAGGHAPTGPNPYLKLILAVVVGWYIVLAILKQALAEAGQARAEATAV